MSDITLAELSRRARELLRTSKLPYAPRHIYGGTADGDQTCAVCDLKIEQGKVVFELDIEVGESRQTLFAHPNCYTAWQQETIQAKIDRQK